MKLCLLHLQHGRDALSLLPFLVPVSGEGHGNTLQDSCLENSVDRRAWWAAVHGVAQSQTRLKQLSMHACIEEGNGNPLQCSCLENPGTEEPSGLPCMADVQLAQSWTRLKRLSSSSSVYESLF